MAGSWLETVMRYLEPLQWVALGLSCVGVITTTVCLMDALGRWQRSKAWGTALHQIIARGHVLSQATMLTVQVGFGIIAALVLTLPQLPVAMYLDHDARRVLIVLIVRKTIRMTLIAMLAVMSVLKYRESRRVHDLTGAELREYQDRSVECQ